MPIAVENSETKNTYDTNTYTWLFNTYYKPLCYFAMKYVGESQQAEEVVGDVFYKLWKKRSDVNIKSSAISYLYSSVRNQALDYLKKNDVLHKSYDISYSYSVADHYCPARTLEYNELQRQHQYIIEKLAPQCKRIYKMSRYEGLKYKEIAEQLGISIKTVETQMRRALIRFRKEINLN